MIRMLCAGCLVVAACLTFTPRAAAADFSVLPADNWTAHPLDSVTVPTHGGTTITVRDGANHEYVHVPATPGVHFIVGGALGAQTIDELDAAGKVIHSSRFKVDAETFIADEGGRFADFVEIVRRTLQVDGGVNTIEWRGKPYRYYEPWILDQSHTMKGARYFDAHLKDMVDVFAASQRKDGMIWSFIQRDPSPLHGYHFAAYSPRGYAWADGGAVFARQPVENHNEANFVDALFLTWQSTGDDTWMQSHLDNARRALDYSMTDPARFSAKYQLLKRGYTIDSWDFQPEDKYLVPFRLGIAQQIDPEKTKFVIFFGDNTAYAQACDQLAAMLEYSHQPDTAKYRERARQIRQKLDAVAWNGHFYTHHVEEDSSVQRDIGVPEDQQFAMSNAYSLNRGITESQANAIIGAYEHLRDHLPNRSPGEWYSVYPPYKAGFGAENAKWQYMNAGVHAHAAAELARGALERGHEQYGAGILLRLRDLANRNGGKMAFAYTGAFDPAPPPPSYSPVDLASAANMSLDTQSHDGVFPWLDHHDGDDMASLPSGSQTLAGIQFAVASKQGRSAAAISAVDKGYPHEVAIPIGRKGAAVYLLHAATHTGPSKVVAAMRFEYTDHSQKTVYILRDKHVASLWFPELKSDNAGVAFRTGNSVCSDVGLSWAAVANPQPEKEIEQIRFLASEEGAMYALVGLTLADRMPYHEAPAVSFGGPDPWSGGLAMFALTEGLAGVRDTGTAMQSVELSPRWDAAKVNSVTVTVRYAASNGYVAYRYRRERNTVKLDVTGNAKQATLRVLLPANVQMVTAISVDESSQPSTVEHVGQSTYAVVHMPLIKPSHVEVNWKE